MTGKGSEIAQGQCCRPGLERLLFGLCLPKQILSEEVGERLQSWKLGAAVDRGPLACQM